MAEINSSKTDETRRAVMDRKPVPTRALATGLVTIVPHEDRQVGK